MATNTGHGNRNGAVKDRVQLQNPRTKRWVKLDTKTGKIVAVKKTDGPYKGITKKN